MAIGNVLQAATIALVSGAGAAIGNLTLASYTISTRSEPAIVIRLDGASPAKDKIAAPPDCTEIDTTGSETRARILDCGERAAP